jgi:branched-chain amino acid transport system permease protein
MVGGLGTLVGPILGCILLQMLTTWAGTLRDVNPNVILGAILMAVVLAVPRGLLPSGMTLLGRVRRGGRR